MRSVSPHSPRNGGGDATPAATPSPAHRRHDRLSPPPPFQSTLSLQKLRRFNTLALVLRLAALCFSLASAVFMATSSRGSASSRWYNFEAYRYVFAANAVVALYSLFELGVSVWEISRNSTLLPEILQVWFDFGHDQIFGYMQLSAGSAGTTLARMLKGSDTCAAGDGFCMPTDIAIALGFASFLFLACSCLLSGFRLACFIIKGSRFHL